MNMRIYLNRVSYSGEGTFGVLKLNAIPFAVTLELPWRDNEPYISCIPEGTYNCHRYGSPKFENTFQICNVPKRTYILFHRANTIDDLRGCIGIAEEFGVLKDQPAILSSGKGFKEFLKLTEKVNKFKLIINAIEDVKPLFE